MPGVNVEGLGRSAASSFERMTGPQRITLALAFAATVMGMFLMARFAGNTPMTTLYADLEPSTAATIVGQLDNQGVAYELVDGGRVIRVPAAEVHSLRLTLSAQGLPGNGEGWSVLDDNGITTSAFDQRVGYQRAMEGELAKTIAAIDGVSSANVHLVIPESDLLSGDDTQASASVLLVRSGSTSLSPMQVDAIVNLVASSVEGLRPDNVSVADETGQVLAAPGEGSGVVGLEGDSQLRAQRSYASVLKNDLEDLLEAVVGPGLAVVTVAVELDFDSVVTVTEQYQPTESAVGDQMMLAETTRAESYSGDNSGQSENGQLAIEVPGENAAEEGAAAAADGVAYNLDERDATFAVDKVITNSENAIGEVASLSVAVLLDETAVDPGRIAEIEELVGAAAGIDTQRGDALAVTLMPLNEQFREAVAAMTPDPDAESGGGLDIIGLVRMLATGFVAALVIILGLRFISKGPSRETVETVDLADMGASFGAGGATGGQGGGGGPGDRPDLKLQNLISNQSDDVASVLRTWLNDDDEART